MVVVFAARGPRVGLVHQNHPDHHGRLSGEVLNVSVYAGIKVHKEMTVRISVYHLEDAWAETSLSTMEANESTTSSGGLPVLVSSPGLYFPVFTKQRRRR